MIEGITLESVAPLSIAVTFNYFEVLEHVERQLMQR